MFCFLVGENAALFGLVLAQALVSTSVNSLAIVNV